MNYEYLLDDLRVMISSSLISIDKSNNVVVNTSTLDSELMDIWNRLTTEDQCELIAERFKTIHSIRFTLEV